MPFLFRYCAAVVYSSFYRFKFDYFFGKKDPLFRKNHPVKAVCS